MKLKEIKAIQEHGKQLVESKALVSINDFIMNKDDVPLEASEIIILMKI